MIELKPCPLCNTADNIHLYRHYPNTIKRYEYGCDCGFFTPSAVTKRGAKRRWNSYVKVWKNGFDEDYQTIMTELDEALEIMRVNVPETKTICNINDAPCNDCQPVCSSRKEIRYE